MKESSAVAVHFLGEYEKLGEKVNRFLREYLGNPGTSQTHDLRSSVRRLDAAIKVLPKQTRSEKVVRRCHDRCRNVLRQTSRLRDIDILNERLSRAPRDETVSLLLNNLREEREEFVGDSTKGAWKLFEHHPPKLGKGDLPRLAQRAQTVLGRLDEKIAEALEISLEDETKADELHRLRKDCKRVRYTLELFPSIRHRRQRLLQVRRWTDLLGEVRDCDVMVGYLSQAKPTETVLSILASERSERHAKYLSFVRLCQNKPLSTVRPSVETGRPGRAR